MSLFKNAPQYYKYRPTYPKELIEVLKSKLHLNGEGNILDIGCGTGSLCIPLSLYFKNVFAVDIDPGMLAEGQKNAQASGVNNITWINESGESLRENFKDIHVVSFGFSLHWFDQEKILKYTFDLLPQGGAILIISGTTIWRYAPMLWQQKVLEVIKKYLGPDRLTLNGKYKAPKNSFEESLISVGFKNLETFDFQYPPNIFNADEIIKMLYSTSYAAPDLFKDKIDDFERELKSELLKINLDDEFENQTKDSIIIGWKK